MHDLRVSILQYDIAWEDPKANRSYLENEFKKLIQQTDLVVLPEMFTTGFSMNPKDNAENKKGKTIGWLRTWAAKINAVITGSIIFEENGKYYNRLIWMPPNGMETVYDKHHLFTMAGEQKSYTKGKSKVITQVQNWRVCPLICYDLRFPEWARNQNDYDLLLFVANWPKPRIAQWNTLLEARAIENVSYTIGVNRIGEDPEGNVYTGHSSILDFKGQPLIRIADAPITYTMKLSGEAQANFRSKFPVLDDKDYFEFKD